MNRRSGVLVLLLVLLVLAVAEDVAAAEPRHAIDRFEPAERGSEWTANESLDLRGKLRPSFGYVLSWARRSLVLEAPTGERAPVEDLAFVHLGGSVVLADRFRLAVNLPLQIYAGGNSAGDAGGATPAPLREEGVGDLRLGFDARVFGAHRQRITGAVGFQAWAPTGERSQWTSDGVFRLRPRAIVAGEIGLLVWSSQVGIFLRDRSEATVAGAIGARIANRFVVGPEIFASTLLSDPFQQPGSPVELLLGGHYLIERTARVSASVGSGLGDGAGAPAFRATVALEWAPAIDEPRRRGPRPGPGGKKSGDERDTDGDGIPDAVDACPRTLGVATSDPRTHGCPPDTDGDGVDDLADACPTRPGLPSPDPAMNGCPDRDRDHDGVPNELDACPDDRGPPDIDPHRSGCPKAFVHGTRIELLDPVEFRSGEVSAELATTPSNEALLAAILGAVLRVPGGTRVRIEGHTDARGDPVANRRLGAARAEAVAAWLVEHGVARARIDSVGFGAERPIWTNDTEAGRADNRRIEIHLEP